MDLLPKELIIIILSELNNIRNIYAINNYFKKMTNEYFFKKLLFKNRYSYSVELNYNDIIAIFKNIPHKCFQPNDVYFNLNKKKIEFIFHNNDRKIKYTIKNNIFCKVEEKIKINFKNMTILRMNVNKRDTIILSKFYDENTFNINISSCCGQISINFNQ